MKIMICSSKHFYGKIPPIKRELEKKGHIITLPNSYDNPMKEEEIRKLGEEKHAKWKAAMLKKDEENIGPCDAILVLNLEKNGQANYIGGATFLEIYKAFELGKKIYLYNPIPKNIFEDELRGVCPVVIEGNLLKVK